jgi:hypothetical protein
MSGSDRRPEYSWIKRIDELLTISRVDGQGTQGMILETLDLYRTFYGDNSGHVRWLEQALEDSRQPGALQRPHQIAKGALLALKEKIARDGVTIYQMREFENEMIALRNDLKWLLAIPRVYRSLSERFARLIPYRRVRRVLAIAAPSFSIVFGAVHYLYGWPRALAWLAKIFTGQ